MGYPDFAAGQRLTAQDLRDMQWQKVEQGSDQIINNTTTLVDTNLTVTLIAGARYLFRALIGYDTGGTPDIRFAWTAPASGEVVRFTWGLGQSGMGGTESFTDVAMRRPLTTSNTLIGGSGVGNVHSYHEEGEFDGGDGGVFTLQFAQSTASATDTRLLASSRINYLRIG